ncbi:extracellular solute-binding protein [Paenibacillus sp. PL2-23]|uniref:extracellular solute-binding protein n=1 Tax=Paenibacillus sp. PL2-23 TaxID=2100729 RepID=UPI0030F4B548
MLTKKLGLVLVILSMMLTACSNGNEGSNSNSSVNSSKGEVSSFSAENPLEIKFGTMNNPQGNDYIELEKMTGETMDNNRWTKLFKEELGIETKYTLSGATGQYSDKLKLAIASNDLPDIYNVPENNLADLKQLAEGGAVQDIGPLYDQFASPLLKSIIEGEGSSIFDSVTFDGKRYGIPVKMPSTNGYNHLWIREDWLKKLNLQRPKTMDDVYEIAKAFANDDPDGNGQKDTIGLAMNQGFYNNLGMSGVFWAYGAFPEFWLKGADGKVTNGTIQPEMKEPLKWLAKMFKEGLVDPEFGSKDWSKMGDMITSNKAGMFYGTHWYAFMAEGSIKNDPNAKWITVPLPSGNGQPVKIAMKNAADGAWVVREGFEHPEKMIEMLNLYVETLFGDDAEMSKWWSEGSVGGVWMMSPVRVLKPTLDLEAHADIKVALANGTTDQLKGIGKNFYESMQNGAWTMEMMFGPKDTPFDFVASSYPDAVIWDEYQGAPTPTQLTATSTMHEFMETGLTKFVLGQVDVDSGFDKFVEDWKKLGGQSIMDEINEIKGIK